MSNGLLETPSRTGGPLPPPRWASELVLAYVGQGNMEQQREALIEMERYLGSSACVEDCLVVIDPEENRLAQVELEGIPGHDREAAVARSVEEMTDSLTEAGFDLEDFGLVTVRLQAKTDSKSGTVHNSDELDELAKELFAEQQKALRIKADQRN